MLKQYDSIHDTQTSMLSPGQWGHQCGRVKQDLSVRTPQPQSVASV